MRRLLRAALLATLLLGMVSFPARAQAPSTLGYQGVLTDGAGNLVPDGAYALTFRIYDAFGSEIWSEVHPAVSVVKGGFSVVLGSVTPINASFGLYAPYQLGIQVGANPELSPRAELTSSPAAMSLTMRGSGGGLTGLVTWLPLGYGHGGGAMLLYDDFLGVDQVSFLPDLNGDGAWAMFRGASGGAMTWDGNAGGGGTLSLTGPVSSMTFATQQSGDPAVQLPAGAVSSAEMLDEPGLSRGFNWLQMSVSSTNSDAFTNMASTTITIPAAGYIVVEATSAVQTIGGAQGVFQISEVSGGPLDLYGTSVGSSDGAAYSWPLHTQRVFNKPAGTYTFYLQGYRMAGPDNLTASRSSVTAFFVPTAYGSVTVAMSAAEAAASGLTPEPVSPASATGGGQDVVLVDLRELELRARRDEARAAESRRLFDQAQAREQQAALAKARAAGPGSAGAAAPSASTPKVER